MRFIHHDLGSLRGDEVVVVTLKGSAANVRLLDSSNFTGYKAGRRHRFYGGHAKKFPVRVQVPRAGHWHVVVGPRRTQYRGLVEVVSPLRHYNDKNDDSRDLALIRRSHVHRKISSTRLSAKRRPFDVTNRSLINELFLPNINKLRFHPPA